MFGDLHPLCRDLASKSDLFLVGVGLGDYDSVYTTFILCNKQRPGSKLRNEHTPCMQSLVIEKAKKVV